MFVFLWAYEQNEMEDSSGICIEKNVINISISERDIVLIHFITQDGTYLPSITEHPAT